MMFWRHAALVAVTLHLTGAAVLGTSAGTTRANQTASGEPSRQGWSWRLQSSDTPSVAASSGIRDGELPVAWIGQEDKVTLLQFGVAPDTGKRLEITLAMEPTGNNVNAEQADLIACLIKEPWTEEAPLAWDELPTRDCATRVAGVFQPESSDFFFDLSALTPALAADSGHGVLIAPDPQTDVPLFQVVFRSARAGGLQVLQGPPANVSSEGSAPRADAPPASRWEAPRWFSDAVAAPEPPAVGAAVGDEVPPLPQKRAARTSSGESRRPSLAGFYIGLAAFGVLVAMRPVLPSLLEVAGRSSSGREEEVGR